MNGAALSWVERVYRPKARRTGQPGPTIVGKPREFKISMFVPSTRYDTPEKLKRLERMGIVVVDNGMRDVPGTVGDHHAPDKVKKEYREYVASELVLTPEWRRALLRRERKSPIRTIIAHRSPYDRDGGIAQFLVKEILAGIIPEKGEVPIEYRNLARYAHAGDKFSLPYVKTPEYTLEGMFHGMNGVHKEDFASMARATDEILAWIAANKADPNEVEKFMSFVENSLNNPSPEDKETIQKYVRPYVEQKRKSLREFEESDEWKNRKEFMVAIPSNGGLKYVKAVHVQTKNMGAVYELVYGRNPDPRIAIISIPNGPTWVSIRPDAATKFGVNLYLIIRKLQRAERELWSKREWFESSSERSIYNFTVTYPVGGPTKLTPSQILHAIKTPPVLLIITGLPGTGKLEIADEISTQMSLANHLGMPLFITDVIRKEEIAGIKATDGSHRGNVPFSGIYSPEMSQRTYDAMRKHAEGLIRDGFSAALVGSFISKEEIIRSVELARKRGVVPIVVNCEVPDEVAEKVIPAEEFSDATPEIRKAMKDKTQVLTPEERRNMGLIPDRTYLTIDSSGELKEVVKRVMEKLAFTFEEIANPSAKAAISQHPFVRPQKPFLLLVCGLPGVGKGTMVEGLQKNPHLGATVFQSDVIRKELANINPFDHSLKALPFQGIYTLDWTKEVYKTIRDRARESLKQGRSVIVDAPLYGFKRGEKQINFREMFFELAREENAALIIAHLKVSKDVAQERMAAAKITTSDADSGIAAVIEKYTVPITQEEVKGFGLNKKTFIEIDTSNLLVGEVIEEMAEKLNSAFAEINGQI